VEMLGLHDASKVDLAVELLLTTHETSAVRVLLDEGEALLAARRWPELRAKVEEARAKGARPDGRSAWLLGEAMRGLGRFQESAELFVEAVGWAKVLEHPMRLLLFSLSLGRVLHRGGRIVRFLETFAATVEAHAKNEAADEDHLILGAMYESLHWWDKALSIYLGAMARPYDARFAEKMLTAVRHAKQCRALGFDPLATFESDTRMCRVCRKLGSLSGADGGVRIAVCGRCSAAFYCSAQCQSADWKEHKANCHKIEAARCCDLCWDESNELKRCGRCRIAKYCSGGCQKEDWARHKNECRE